MTPVLLSEGIQTVTTTNVRRLLVGPVIAKNSNDSMKKPKYRALKDIKKGSSYEKRRFPEGKNRGWKEKG